MGRKRVISKKKMKNWDEVNEALRNIAELQSALDSKVAAYNEAEAKRRKAVDQHCNPIREQIEKMENGMADFCETHRQDFGDKKGKELPNGRVDFRMSTPKVGKAKGFTWKAILDIMRKSSLGKAYLRITEGVNKDQILADYAAQKITQQDLEEFFIKVDQAETFGYKVYFGANKEAA